MLLYYTTCFVHQDLFMMWPTEFHIKEAIACKLLSVEYRPQLVNRVTRLSFSQGTNNELKLTLVHQTIKGTGTHPRYGSVCWPKDEKNIFIFGGVFNDVNDFLCLPPGITRLQLLSNNGVEFKSEPKSVSGDRLKPKMFYSILPKPNSTNEIYIYGGFGRDFTNMFSLFSCYCYEFDTARSRLQKKKHPMRVIRLPGPLHNRKVGLFNIINEEKGAIKFT